MTEILRMLILLLAGVIAGGSVTHVWRGANDDTRADQSRAELARRVMAAENTLIRLGFRVNELESRRRGRP